MLPLGALAVLAAWRYTGGDNPYGYRGLGEVYVFVFFGLMATLGTQYTQADAVTWFGVLGAVGVGAVASAILVANNLRDIPTDTEHGKRTLAVRLGDRRTRLLYTGLVAVSVLTLAGMAFWEPWVLLGLLALPLAVKGVRTVAVRHHRARPGARAGGHRALRGRLRRARRARRRHRRRPRLSPRPGLLTLGRARTSRRLPPRRCCVQCTYQAVGEVTWQDAAEDRTSRATARGQAVRPAEAVTAC